jgi:hypothetical protein
MRGCGDAGGSAAPEPLAVIVDGRSGFQSESLSRVERVGSVVGLKLALPCITEPRTLTSLLMPAHWSH